MNADGRVSGLRADCAKLPPEGSQPANPPAAVAVKEGAKESVKELSAADAEEAGRAAQAFAAALDAGNLEAAWDALPASYRKDLTDLTHDFAGRMDPKLWVRLMAVAKNSGTLLDTKREDVTGFVNALKPE